MVANPEDHFAAQKPATVYKHGILKRYASIFSGMAASVVQGRATLLDGYAGKGQYGDDETGVPGSPLLFLRAATDLRLARSVRCLLVEQDPKIFKQLEANIAKHADPEITVVPMLGSLDDRLDECLEAARGTALFAFLDPFGSCLSAKRVLQILDRPGRAPTEVLMLWSIAGVRRAGGQVRKVANGADIPGGEATAERFDEFLGGSWWRSYFANSTKEIHEVALEVADEYCRRIQRATSGYTPVTTLVRDKQDHKPKYLLAFFTAHPEGVWKFADACSYALVDWQEKVHDDADAKRVKTVAGKRAKEDALGVQRIEGLGDPSVTPMPFNRIAYKAMNEPVWIAAIERNIVKLLRSKGPVKFVDFAEEVYGDYLGEANETHVRQATKNLFKRGQIDNDGVQRSKPVKQPPFYRRVTRLIVTPLPGGAPPASDPTSARQAVGRRTSPSHRPTA